MGAWYYTRPSLPISIKYKQRIRVKRYVKLFTSVDDLGGGPPGLPLLFVGAAAAALGPPPAGSTATVPASTDTHRKKSFSIFPSPAGMSFTKLSLGGNIDVINKLFPPRESLVSDTRLETGISKRYRILYFVTNTIPFLFFTFLQ